jgi:hypothetical protein
MCLAGKIKKKAKNCQNIFLFFWITILYFMVEEAGRHKKIKKTFFLIIFFFI